jgi:hypothetical protein
MESALFFELGKYSLLLFIILSGLLFIALKALRLVLNRYAHEQGISRWIQQHFSALELAIWLIYFLWFLPWLYQKNVIYGIALSLIVFVILAWVSWFSIREVVAGFIVKNNPAIKVGNQIETEEKLCKIQRLNTQDIELKDETGNIRFIKYSHFLQNKWTLMVDEELIFSRTIQMVLKKEQNTNHIEEINHFLLNQAHFALKHSPQIMKLKESEQELELKVTFYTLNSTQLGEMERRLRERFERIQ